MANPKSIGKPSSYPGMRFGSNIISFGFVPVGTTQGMFCGYSSFLTLGFGFDMKEGSVGGGCGPMVGLGVGWALIDATDAVFATVALALEVAIAAGPSVVSTELCELRLL